MAAAWFQILLLACSTITSMSLSCNDVICCPGEVCVEEASGRNGTIIASCVPQTSCHQLQCPSGFACMEESQAERRVTCQPSCNNVQCPGSLQCVENGPITACIFPEYCSLLQCPAESSCHVHEISGRMIAACFAQSCKSIQCSKGSKCVDVSFLDTTTGSGSGQGNGENVACLPSCDESDICPQGLVCEKHAYQIFCREPRSCSELQCPRGEICEEVRCGIRHGGKNVPNRPSVVRCVVDVTQSSGSGSGENEGIETGGLGNDDLLTSSASSLLTTKQETLVSATSALVLLFCAFFLLHL